ncbi:restriction endonuclease subunit S [Patescibacteria group bacterium]
MPTIKIRKDDKKRPNLRFSEFSSDWQELPIGEFLNQKIREIPKPNTPYKAIGIRSHFKGTFQKPNSDPAKIAMEKLFIVKQDDLVVNITFAWEGALAIVTEVDDGGLVSHRFPTYVFDEEKILKEYFRYVFPTKRFKYVLTTISPGGAGRNRVLNKKDFLTIGINLPTIHEQQKIADFLTKVDEYIKNITAKKEKLEAYKKGMMQKIFSQEIRFKDHNGKDFPEWKDNRLGEIATFLKGKGISKAEIDMNGTNKCIRYGELYTDYNEVIENVVSKTNVSKQRSILSEINDILIPSSGETPIDIATASCINESDILIGGDLNIIRLKKGHDGIFFAYYLTNNEKINIAKMAQGNSVVHLYNSHLRKLKIYVPSLEEQQKIADFLSSIDNLIEAKHTQISKAKNWKKGLLQQLFV